MSRHQTRFLRDLEAGPLLDLVLIMAVLAVLAIRFWLHVTGYPRIGGDALHIAHMLWGGLLMLAALVLLLAFLDRHTQRLAAIVGGLGFGAFIDEVGKFVTHDNDYFYEPAVSVIYVVLVLLYVAGRAVTGRRWASREENLANALNVAGELAANDLDHEERERALAYLDASDDRHGLASALRGALLNADLVQRERPGWMQRQSARLVDAYRQLAGHPWFGWGLGAFFSLQLLARVLRLMVALHMPAPQPGYLLSIPIISPLPADVDRFAIADWLQLGSGLLAGVFVAMGLRHVFRDRLRALRSFQRATVTTLCVTQAFVFYRVEWFGLGELAVNLMILAGLRFAIARERGRGAGSSSSPAAATER